MEIYVAVNNHERHQNKQIKQRKYTQLTWEFKLTAGAPSISSIIKQFGFSLPPSTDFI